MKKILFPTDFSPLSLNAFKYALHFAKSSNAEIIILHVYDLPIVTVTTIDAPIYLNEMVEEIDLSFLENFKSKITILKDEGEKIQYDSKKIRSLFIKGNLINTILNTIKKEEINFVVMGTSGASGIKEWVFGSTTATIMESTSAIVLGIPENVRFMPIRQIAFATNFTKQSRKALKKVIKLAKIFDAKISCIYVKTKKSKINYLTIASWKMFFKKEAIDYYILKNNAVENTIIHFINHNDVNMLAVLKTKHAFLNGLFHKNLPKKLAYHLKAPLLTLHSN